MHPITDEVVDLRLERDPGTQSLMAALQAMPIATFLPRMIHAAAKGGWETLASFAFYYRGALAQELYEGMFHSVTCAEDLPFIDPEDATRVAEDTFLGLARHEAQAAAWPPRARRDTPDR